MYRSYTIRPLADQSNRGMPFCYEDVLDVRVFVRFLFLRICVCLPTIQFIRISVGTYWIDQII